MMDASARPGDNLFTNSLTSWDPDTGTMNWYFQYTPNDMWDFDEAGTHILFEREVNGERRRLITHSARNGFVYTMERHNGQIVMFLASGRPNFWGTPNKPRLPRVRTVWFNTIRDVVG